jgi:hypothetical protein
LLKIDPKERLTIEEVLEDKLFEGIAENIDFNQTLDLYELMRKKVIIMKFKFETETEELE